MTRETKDGGQAFPAQLIYNYPDSSTVMRHQGGMTLRDWFAGQVISGMGTAKHNDDWMEHGGGAARAYRIADAMIKAREATHED